MGKQTSRATTVDHTTYTEGRKTHKATIVKMHMTCGNAGCACMREGALHGPYFYIRVRIGKQVKYFYQGKSYRVSTPADATGVRG